jgi:hypothetical protein
LGPTSLFACRAICHRHINPAVVPIVSHRNHDQG